MEKYHVENLDISVIGAGHAGIEAGLAAARLGCRVGVFTICLDGVGNMPCNPSIGGTAKGHLVCEIDALGGEMGKAADATFLQSRMLNLGKGPAVHSLRVQSDRKGYTQYMKHALERQENLMLIQGEIVEIETKGNQVSGVVTHLGAQYGAKAVILATGTYLKGEIIIGKSQLPGGPDGMFPANQLSDCLKALGVPLRTFKTGTPARVNRRSLDFSKMTLQEGDKEIIPFSFEHEEIGENTEVCYLTATNETTHQIIRDNIHLSPIYSGQIHGIGPRYCPSIEDKIMRFKEKTSHQLFVEPCGKDTEEMYLQGLSSSLPEYVQRAFIHSIKGLEKAEIMRVAYAIQYDCVDPQALLPTLEFKAIKGLYGAGQFNGSSGYEEAAAQGLVAGINAARRIQQKEPFILDRASSYIGTLIDDLVTKGTPEPYRMMTSRSEYRLLLRQDNADLRLTPMGYELGLISEERYQKFLQKKANIDAEIKRLRSTHLSHNNEKANEILIACGTAPLTGGASLAELIARPQVGYEDLAPVDPDRPKLTRAEGKQAEISIKYEGYIEKQLAKVREFQKLENRRLPEDLCYEEMEGLRLEARQKLAAVRPVSIGQASRISGVSPADISVLMLELEQRRHKKG
ncbi:MAG: tRNA uridine-5-carboxymethylaminomethyl(34) synthesis enzyme MnmG [Clostridia bacterium]|nr:tRNA uridine-5-carboxymethylaminomethyl(34) synthesis enzyme MnmG [Clostridia bacterium]